MEPGAADQPIVSHRLVLVPLAVEDAAEMAPVLDDERVHAFTGGRPLNTAQLRSRYEELVAGSGTPDELWLNSIVRAGPDRVAVGTVQATVSGPNTSAAVATIAWVIGVPFQGRGYATEAAHALVVWLFEQDVGVVAARIHPDHRASISVARHAGLQRTGDMLEGEEVWERTLGVPRGLVDGGEAHDAGIRGRGQGRTE